MAEVFGEIVSWRAPQKRSTVDQKCSTTSACVTISRSTLALISTWPLEAYPIFGLRHSQEKFVSTHTKSRTACLNGPPFVGRAILFASTGCRKNKRREVVDPQMKARLEADGWTLGSAQSFLDLSDEDMATIDMKLALDDSGQSSN